MTFWPAQVSRRFILENRWVGLFGPWWTPESPARTWVFTSSLAWGPATPSLPWFLPISGLRTRHFFPCSCQSDLVTSSQSLRGSFSQPQNICVTSSLQGWKVRGAEAPSILFVAALGP